MHNDRKHYRVYVLPEHKSERSRLAGFLSTLVYIGLTIAAVITIILQII